MTSTFLAANIVLLPYNFFVSSSGEAARTTLANSSLNILLALIHYRKCVMVESVKNRSEGATPESLLKEETYFSENPYCKALENTRDVECEILYLVCTVVFMPSLALNQSRFCS